MRDLFVLVFHQNCKSFIILFTQIYSSIKSFTKKVSCALFGIYQMIFISIESELKRRLCTRELFGVLNDEISTHLIILFLAILMVKHQKYQLSPLKDYEDLYLQDGQMDQIQVTPTQSSITRQPYRTYDLFTMFRPDNEIRFSGSPILMRNNRILQMSCYFYLSGDWDLNELIVRNNFVWKNIASLSTNTKTTPFINEIECTLSTISKNNRLLIKQFVFSMEKSNKKYARQYRNIKKNQIQYKYQRSLSIRRQKFNFGHSKILKTIRFDHLFYEIKCLKKSKQK